MKQGDLIYILDGTLVSVRDYDGIINSGRAMSLDKGKFGIMINPEFYSKQDLETYHLIFWGNEYSFMYRFRTKKCK